LRAKGAQIAILLASLALCALFLAKGTTTLVAKALFPAEGFDGGAETKAAKKPPGTDPPDIKAILARNAFDPSTGPLWPPKPAEAPPAEEAEETIVEEQPIPGQMPPACDDKVKLVATVFSERFPDWSFATLGSGSDAPLLYRIGGKVTDRELVSVYPRSVYLRQTNGRLCSLTLFGTPSAAKPSAAPAAPAEPTPAPAVASTAASGSLGEAELDAAINKQSESSYTVQRDFVDKLLSNQAEIMRSARIVPHEENGQVVGVKLYGIRRNSLLGKLGMQNGDLLRTINGYDMASPDSALEAYAKLRSAANLSVAVTRRGQPMALEYNIQ
jgi:general secretion pathway protein C